MLKEIAIITISVTNLGAVQDAYEKHFAYETVETGQVSEAQAELWQTPATAGNDYVVMQPSKMKPVYLRFVQNDPVEGYGPTRTQGWNAFELVVKSPDTLVDHLDGSPFNVIGQPKDLYPTEGAPRVMQAVGPGDEVIYLTRPGGGKVDEYEDTFVGRSFIVVSGGPNIERQRRWWNKSFSTPVAPAQDYKITTISKLNDLPLDTTYPLALVPIEGGSMIELDGYPRNWPRRTANKDALPPGIAVVSFELAELSDYTGDWVSEPRAIDAAPYNGRKVGLAVGPNGEWIELMEAEPEE